MKKNTSVLAVCCLLALITLACYWPVARLQFVNLDDHQYIYENVHVIPGLTWTGVTWAFQTGYAGNWHPLTWLSHMLDSQLFGLNPAGHHVVNLLFHVANAVLLLLLLNRMTGALWRSAFVAAAFAWHPLRVESVAWASERKDVLCAFFFLLTLWAYAAYARGAAQVLPSAGTASPSRANQHRFPPAFYYSMALLCFALGLMSKPMLVTLPCVLLLLDIWPLNRFGRAALAEKIPFFVLSLVSCLVTFVVQRSAGAVGSLEAAPLSVRLANALLAYGSYLAKTFWPSGLAAVYPYAKPLPIGLVTASALVLGFLSAFFLARARRQPFLLVGWLWFLGMLVPTIGLIQVGSQSMADRYTYLPSIGLLLVIVWGLADLASRAVAPRRALAALGAVALALCAWLTPLQVRTWQNSETLFRHALHVTSGNYIAYDGLGSALENRGAHAEALAAFAEAVRLKPQYAEGHYDLGTALMKQGNLEEAIKHLTLALKHNPNFSQAHSNLGRALLKRGDLEQAAPHLQQAVALSPDDPEAHYNLGTLRLMQARLDEAAASFSRALSLRPTYPDAHSNLGIVCMRQGKAAEGLAHFAEAARQDPRNPETHFNLGLALRDQQRPVEAAAAFSAALGLQPDNAKYHFHLASCLAAQRQSKQAIVHYRQALRQQPGAPEVLDAVAWLEATDPDPAVRDGSEAVKLARQAAELTQRQQSRPLITLAAACAEAGDFPGAISAAKEALALTRTSGQTNLADKAERLLKLFETGKPFRE